MTEAKGSVGLGQSSIKWSKNKALGFGILVKLRGPFILHGGCCQIIICGLVSPKLNILRETT